MHIFALPVITLASLVVGADAACTKPPKGAIIVDHSGGHSGYRTIGEAVRNLDDSTKEEQTIFIYKGKYAERVVISELNGPLVLQGYTCDTMSYDSNQVTITHKMSHRDVPPHAKGDSNDLASTLSINTDNVQVYNLNLANPFPKTPQKGQAPALSVVCKKCAFYACKITGYQDTLYANRGDQFYGLTFIEGGVDFIFGSSRAFFQKCVINAVGAGYITANGRDSNASKSYFVLNKAKITGSEPGDVYLGRPWKKYSRVVVQNSDLGNVIHPLGWKAWTTDGDTSNVQFKEYNNVGPSAATKDRASFSGQLKRAISISTILGKDFETFVNKTYL